MYESRSAGMHRPINDASVLLHRDYATTARDVCCFFFQAEDGIRDYKVTGVQTCALPIFTGDAQGVSNIEATRAARLFELWSEWAIGADESLRVGLYDFNSEFDSNATGALLDRKSVV